MKKEEWSFPRSQCHQQHDGATTFQCIQARHALRATLKCRGWGSGGRGAILHVCVGHLAISLPFLHAKKLARQLAQLLANADGLLFSTQCMPTSDTLQLPRQRHLFFSQALHLSGIQPLNTTEERRHANKATPMTADHLSQNLHKISTVTQIWQDSEQDSLQCMQDVLHNKSQKNS